MRRLAILGILVSVFLLVVPALVNAASPPAGIVGQVTVVNPSSKPVPVTGTLGTTSPCCYRFVGLSEGTTTGNAGGRVGMNAICQATYGLTSRMCTTQEFLSSPVSSAPAAFASWIQPVISNVVYAPPSEGQSPELILFDYSGYWWEISSGKADCRGWTDDSSDVLGLTYRTDVLNIIFYPCDGSRHVVCCAP